MALVESDMAIDLRAASKSFGQTRVLRGVDFAVRKGSIVAIIGPSGGGKSTLLKCLNLLTLIDAGELRYDGHLVVRAEPGRELSLSGWVTRVARTMVLGPSDGPICRRHVAVRPYEYRQRVALVFQDFNLWPSRTVLENLTEGPIYAKREARKECRSRALDTLGQFGLADLAGRYPHQLSGGQRQRVAIARALVMRPEVLLLDEVTSALDPELVGDVLEMLRDLARRGLTMVIVTHHIEFARDVADWVVMLEKGEIIERGPASEMLSVPEHERTMRFIRAVSSAR